MRRAAAVLALLVAAASARAQAPHACEALQRSALEAAVGAPLAEGRRVMAACVFDGAKGRGQVTVQFRHPGDPTSDYDDRKKALQLAGGTMGDVSGLGDAAVWAAGPDQLLIRKGARMVLVDPGLVGKAPARERAIAIGKASLAALP